MDYLQKTGQANPEAQLQAEKYVATGYQRLVTFEVPGGGFSLFGNPPAEVFLTAYGLMEFSDMAKVYPVDPALIERTAQWLMNQQNSNGTWTEQGYSEHWNVTSQTATTAYIAWALIEAGYKSDPQVRRAIEYIREFARQEEDAYSLSLVANALSAYDPDDSTTKAVLQKLHDMRVKEDGDGAVYWQADMPSFMGATGESGSLETTALAAMAFMRGGDHPEAVQGALTYLVQGKDSWGTWQTTQATILSLKAMLMAADTAGNAAEAATVRVSLNKEQSQEINIDPTKGDVVHSIIFNQGFSRGGTNEIQLEVKGGENLMYQVASSYYLPWDALPVAPEAEEAVSIDLTYDRTELSVNDTVNVDVKIALKQGGVVKMALIDLGVPPGFTVLSEDLARLVEQSVISRYELTGRQIIIYLENLSSEQPVKFSYRLRARFPMRAQTPPSSAYDYYNPTQQTIKAPLEMAVLE
ncbi:MAG TPA: hypothetical protein G4N96_12645 [Chloroflexi bacterium]|nr:hypothetical protein [Chloroflexota bacterium]